MSKHFIRGGQTALHFIRMFVQVSKKLLKFGVVSYLLLAGILVYRGTSPYQRYLLGQYCVARLALVIQGEQAEHQFRGMRGEKFKLKASQFARDPFVKASLYVSQTAFCNSFLIVAFSMILIMVFLYEKGRRQLILEEIRGAFFLKPKLLRIFLTKHQKNSDITLGGVPLVKGAETQHILVTGTTGAGKSVCMMELMDNIRRRKQRAIVYDVVGAFIQHYYRPGRDIILNPLDERCPSWNIWQEGQDVADFEAHAASLMPLHLSGNDPFWIHSARTIFSTLAEQLKATDNMRTQSLLRPMFSSNLSALNTLLRGTVAETLVAEGVEKMALSIKATLSTYCKCLRYLKEEGNTPLFSIKQWLQQEKHDGWIFIASNAEKLEAVKPLISVWMDIAARGALSLSPSFDRRIWFLIDELASLHRLPSLSLLLSQGRKYGVCAVTAFQDIHQIRAIYGRDDSEALLSMYNTNLCYRTKCPDTAHWLSRVVGQREIVEKKEGFSYGANDVRDGVSMHQERRKEPLILDTEFLRLGDNEAYLVLPENVPITKIKLFPKNRDICTPTLIPRNFAEFSLLREAKENAAAAKAPPEKEIESQPAPNPNAKTPSFLPPVPTPSSHKGKKNKASTHSSKSLKNKQPEPDLML